VRVVTRAEDEDDLEPGDILVCEVTDPSWTPLFMLVDAVVIDVGAPGSHGAIIARELGLPSVVNTIDGSRRLRSGDRVEVDGTAGTVTVVALGDAAGG
jgi:pyruvate,water dikinase